MNEKLESMLDYDALIDKIKKLIPFFTIFELPLSNLFIKTYSFFNSFVEKNNLEIYFHTRKKQKYSQSELLFILFFYKKVKCKGIIIHPLVCFQEENIRKIILNTQLFNVLFLENANTLFLTYYKKELFKNIAFDIAHFLYLKQKYIDISEIKYVHLRGYNKNKKYERLINSYKVINILKKIISYNNSTIIILEYPYSNDLEILEDYTYLLKEVQ